MRHRPIQGPPGRVSAKSESGTPEGKRDQTRPNELRFWAQTPASPQVDDAVAKRGAEDLPQELGGDAREEGA